MIRRGSMVVLVLLLVELILPLCVSVDGLFGRRLLFYSLAG